MISTAFQDYELQELEQMEAEIKQRAIAHPACISEMLTCAFGRQAYLPQVYTSLFNTTKDRAAVIHEIFYRLRVTGEKISCSATEIVEWAVKKVKQICLCYSRSWRQLAEDVRVSASTAQRAMVDLAKKGCVYWDKSHYQNQSYEQNFFTLVPIGVFNQIVDYAIRVKTEQDNSARNFKKLHEKKGIFTLISDLKAIYSQYLPESDLPSDEEIVLRFKGTGLMNAWGDPRRQPIQKDTLRDYPSGTLRDRASFQHNVPEIEKSAHGVGTPEQKNREVIDNHISSDSRMEKPLRKIDEVAAESEAWMKEQLENYCGEQPPNNEEGKSNETPKPAIVDKHFGSFDTKEYRREMARQSVKKHKENKSRLTEEQELQFKVEYRDRAMAINAKTTRESANKSAEILAAQERNTGTNLEVTDWLEKQQLKKDNRNNPFADAIAVESVMWEKLFWINEKLGLTTAEAKTVRGALRYKSVFPEDWSKTTGEIQKEINQIIFKFNQK